MNQISEALNLTELHHQLLTKPFVPARGLANGHLQTILVNALPRPNARRAVSFDERRLFRVDADTQLLGWCGWQSERSAHPTVLLLHGLEGSSESGYVLGLAEKAFRAGFNTVRLNQRNCGGTENLTPTLYHSGLIHDFVRVAEELIATEKLSRLYLCGVSMTGNMLLRLGGMLAGKLPPEILGFTAISPAIDLSATAARLQERSSTIYHRHFLSSLNLRVRRKQKLYPQLYGALDLSRVRSIHDFDTLVTAPFAGFATAEDYYRECSALTHLSKIKLPTLVIHAHDDPFVPITPLLDKTLEHNSTIIRLLPAHGGHVGFYGRRRSYEDRLWAENRVMEFLIGLEKLTEGGNPGSN